MTLSPETTNLIDMYKIALVDWATEVAKGAITPNERRVYHAENRVHQARYALESHVARIEQASSAQSR